MRSLTSKKTTKVARMASPRPQIQGRRDLDTPTILVTVRIFGSPGLVVRRPYHGEAGGCRDGTKHHISFVVYTTIFRESLISGEGGEVRLTIRGREACNTMTLTTSPEDSTVQKWQITWVQLGS